MYLVPEESTLRGLVLYLVGSVIICGALSWLAECHLLLNTSRYEPFEWRRWMCIMGWSCKPLSPGQPLWPTRCTEHVRNLSWTVAGQRRYAMLNISILIRLVVHNSAPFGTKKIDRPARMLVGALARQSLTEFKGSPESGSTEGGRLPTRLVQIHQRGEIIKIRLRASDTLAADQASCALGHYYRKSHFTRLEQDDPSKWHDYISTHDGIVEKIPKCCFCPLECWLRE